MVVWPRLHSMQASILSACSSTAMMTLTNTEGLPRPVIVLPPTNTASGVMRSIGVSAISTRATFGRF